MDRAVLAETLKAARARIAPADVGLPAGVHRRVAGLRREEVAQLAGISVDYLVRLEQARAPKPSDQVLAALARAGGTSRLAVWVMGIAGLAMAGAAIWITHWARGAIDLNY